MEALKLRHGDHYTQPQRPLGMGITIPKIAAYYVLTKVQPAVSVSAGAHQIVVNAK